MALCWGRKGQGTPSDPKPWRPWEAQHPSLVPPSALGVWAHVDRDPQKLEQASSRLSSWLQGGTISGEASSDQSCRMQDQIRRPCCRSAGWGPRGVPVVLRTVPVTNCRDHFAGFLVVVKEMEGRVHQAGSELTPSPGAGPGVSSRAERGTRRRLPTDMADTRGGVEMTERLASVGLLVWERGLGRQWAGAHSSQNHCALSPRPPDLGGNVLP